MSDLVAGRAAGRPGRAAEGTRAGAEEDAGGTATSPGASVEFSRSGGATAGSFFGLVTWLGSMPGALAAGKGDGAGGAATGVGDAAFSAGTDASNDDEELESTRTIEKITIPAMAPIVR